MGPGDDANLRALGDQLHRQLLGGDLTASAQIAELFLPVVAAHLGNRYHGLYDSQLAETAAEDAILEYLMRPGQFDPARLPLHKYLIMSARGDLLNLLRKESNLGLPTRVQIVELDAPEREHIEEKDDAPLGTEEQAFLLSSPVWPLLQELLPDPTDLEVALMMLEGVRETREYAAILGIGHMPKTDLEAEIKRRKDRIKKSLQRHIDRRALDEER